MEYVCIYMHPDRLNGKKNKGQIITNTGIDFKSRTLIYCIKYPNRENLHINERGLHYRNAYELTDNKCGTVIFLKFKWTKI